MEQNQKRFNFVSVKVDLEDIDTMFETNFIIDNKSNDKGLLKVYIPYHPNTELNDILWQFENAKKTSAKFTHGQDKQTKMLVYYTKDPDGLIDAIGKNFTQDILDEYGFKLYQDDISSYEIPSCLRYVVEDGYFVTEKYFDTLKECCQDCLTKEHFNEIDFQDNKKNTFTINRF